VFSTQTAKEVLVAKFVGAGTVKTSCVELAEVVAILPTGAGETQAAAVLLPETR
jgi:hypothetical protein